MAKCPQCASRDHMSVGRTGRLIVTGLATLAGVNVKYAATDEYLMECDRERGGCGWSVRGYIEDGYLVVADA